MKDEALAARVREFGAEPTTNTPEVFAHYISSEIEKWAGIVRGANLQGQQ